MKESTFYIRAAFIIWIIAGILVFFDWFVLPAMLSVIGGGSMLLGLWAGLKE